MAKKPVLTKTRATRTRISPKATGTQKATQTKNPNRFKRALAAVFAVLIIAAIPVARPLISQILAKGTASPAPAADFQPQFSSGPNIQFNGAPSQAELPGPASAEQASPLSQVQPNNQVPPSPPGPTWQGALWCPVCPPE